MSEKISLDSSDIVTKNVPICILYDMLGLKFFSSFEKFQ